MKASFCLHGDWFATKPELVELLGTLNYDAVEIWPQAIAALGIEAVRERLAETGLAAASVNTYFNFTESQETYDQSLLDAEAHMDFAVQLGSPNIRAYTSKMGAYETSATATGDEWRRAIDGLKAVCGGGAERGLTVLMEVHHGDGQLYDTTPSTKRLLEGVGADNLKVNLQPPLLGEDFYESTKALGPYTTHVHANNWLGEWGKFCMLDEGSLDFERFLRILRGFGFDGFISVEHSHRDPMAVAAYEIKYLRYLFAKLEKDGK